MTADVIQLHGDAHAAGDRALAAATRHLGRSKLADNTKRAYTRQITTYMTWLTAHPGQHPDAFADVVGAEAAVTAWRRQLLTDRAKPASVNQALAAVTLLYQQAGIRIDITRARIPRPGEPSALQGPQRGAVDRAAQRRGVRDAAIIAVLADTGARVEECARLDLADVTLTARTGMVRLLGKGDQVREIPATRRVRNRLNAWLDLRGRDDGPLWTGQRGRLTISGITQVVLAVGANAGITGLRPHRLRHDYATRLRQGRADVAQVKELMGHASLDTTGRYFRPGATELAEMIERILD